MATVSIGKRPIACTVYTTLMHFSMHIIHAACNRPIAGAAEGRPGGLA